MAFHNFLNKHKNKENHPLAHILVYGFAGVSFGSSSLAAWIIYKLLHSTAFSFAAFALVLGKFYSIAGGFKGINRAIGNGSYSVENDLLASGSRKEGCVRVVVISDTHNFNPATLPEGDILVHCGDFTLKGTSREIEDFCNWLEKQPFPHKVVIAGNHDMGLEFLSTEEAKAAHQRLSSICTLLENSGAVVGGLSFWGSPQTPYISKKTRMGYQDSSENLKPFWDRIPQEVDVLITHGPARGYGDRILLGKHVGCPNLTEKIKQVKPRYHLFGHIHEGYGTYMGEGCVFINAAICNILYNPIHAPIVLDIPLRSGNKQ